MSINAAWTEKKRALDLAPTNLAKAHALFREGQVMDAASRQAGAAQGAVRGGKAVLLWARLLQEL